MCHGNLKVSFGKAITCIGGRNGSGKSAIMIALGILFGQRAHTLDRGNSYVELIKSGTNQAVIRVTINNHLKYKYDAYGEFIVVEKRIRPSSTRVSIGNTSGKLFKIGKNELDNIVEQYNLKFENPLNFLTQDKSKRLLNTASAEDLYEFYHVGTELKGTVDKLTEGLGILVDMQSVVKEVTLALETIEAKKMAEEKNLEFLSFDADSALSRLETEEKWSEVFRMRKGIGDIEMQIEAHKKEIALKNEESSMLVDVLNKNVQEESTKELEDGISQLKIQLHDVDGELTDYISDKGRTLEQLDAIKKRNNKDQLETAILAYENELADRKRCYSELEAQRAEVYGAYQEEKNENEKKTGHIQNLKRQLTYLNQNSIDKNKKDQLDTFGRIEQEMKKISFKDRVIGPVCKHITLKEHKWYKTASIILKKTLTNYIVFNHEDKMKLHNLFKRLNVYYSVTHVFRKTAYQNVKTNPEYKTLLDVLHIDEPLVFNQLVTFHSIEQIILIEDRNMAHKIVRSAPRSVDCAYTLTGDKIKLSNGSLSDFRQKDDGVYWFEDNESKIKKIQYEIERIQTSDKARDKYNGIMSGLQSAIIAIDDIEKKIPKLRIELESLKEADGCDVEGVERKYNALLRSISALETRKTMLVGKMESVITARDVIVKKNSEMRVELGNRKSKARERQLTLSGEIMTLESQKIKLEGRKKETSQEISKLAVNIGTEPDQVRSINEISAERKAIYEFKARASTMKSKETIAMEIRIMNEEIAHYQSMKERYELMILETQEICSMMEAKRDEIKEKDTELACRLFREYTERSGYRGEITIDHENKKLDLRMRIHNSTVSGSRSTLSGGERSFAGVCFLLSMWKCFKCPVKVLDEFDVFMDPLNRKVAITALLEFFRESESQVILITPLDTSDLNGSDCDVKILKKGGEI